MARLVPFEDGSRQRPGGRDHGLFEVPDDFDAPLPEKVLSAFES